MKGFRLYCASKTLLCLQAARVMSVILIVTVAYDAYVQVIGGQDIWVIAPAFALFVAYVWFSTLRKIPYKIKAINEVIKKVNK